MIRIFIAFMLSISPLAVVAAPLPCAVETKQQVAATYLADDGRQVDACFDLPAKRVTVRLPDSTVLTLPVAISGSGARYSNGGKTFWEHQGTGRLMEGEKLLFEGKIKPQAGYNSGVTSKLLAKTTVTANGQKIAYPVTDKAEVTAMVVDIAPGAETGWHKHAVPVYAYMLSGAIEATIEGGKTIIYSAGDPIIEVVNTFHNAINKGDKPASLVVFYIGIKGEPLVTRK